MPLETTTITCESSQLNCRVQISDPVTDQDHQCFCIELIGSIVTQTMPCQAHLHMEIIDVTEGLENAQPVFGIHSESEKPFEYHTLLGTLEQRTTRLSRWTSIGQIDPATLCFERQGLRSLMFRISLLPDERDDLLARSTYILTFQNPQPGYRDYMDDQQQVRTVGAALALALVYMDGRPSNAQRQCIGQWLLGDIKPGPIHSGSMRRFNQSVKKLERMVQKYKPIGLMSKCQELVDDTTQTQRSDMIRLCLDVLSDAHHLSATQLTWIKQYKTWLQLDPQLFRDQLAQTIPIQRHEYLDLEALLGITDTLNSEQILDQLTREYAKWNPRVTSTDPAIREQADRMLALIAETRQKHIKS